MLFLHVQGLKNNVQFMGLKLKELLDKQVKSLEVFQEFKWTDLMIHLL